MILKSKSRNNYLKNLSSTSKKNIYKNKKTSNNETNIVEDGISWFIPVENQSVNNVAFSSTLNIATPELTTQTSTPKLVKSNLQICKIEKNGFFEKIFGETEVDTDDFGDGRRIKVKFWNQNYFIFSSLGCSAKFQKRTKFLGISG